MFTFTHFVIGMVWFAAFAVFGIIATLSGEGRGLFDNERIRDDDPHYSKK